MRSQAQLLYQQETLSGLVEVWQKGEQRWLNIDDVQQSRISVNHPEILLSTLHHAFLAALLFIDTPEKILLAGLGGGAIARYLHHINPAIKGDAVEINETVVSVAKQFFYFPEARWNIDVDDIRQWQGEYYDLIIVDIAEAELTPAWLASEVILSQLKKQLSEHGVLVLNLLVNDAHSLSQVLSIFRKVFEKQTLCLTVPVHKNIVVLAFNQHPENISDAVQSSRMNVLNKIWGVNFETLFEQLKSDNPVGCMGGDIF